MTTDNCGNCAVPMAECPCPTTKHLYRDGQSFSVECDYRPGAYGGYEHWASCYVTDAMNLTCRFCLESLVRAGEGAVERMIELDTIEGGLSNGGTCPHDDVHECVWCEDQYCLSPACRKVVRPPRANPNRTEKIACPECRKLEDEVQFHVYDAPNREKKIVKAVQALHPIGLAAFSAESHDAAGNKHRAMVLLRAALGRLGPKALDDFRNPTLVFQVPKGLDQVTLINRINALRAAHPNVRAIFTDSEVSGPNVSKLDDRDDDAGVNWHRDNLD